jgi:3-hydroxymyristoyl/3-hydroxydecanoyl-(acyl carrier protein) dehydratase
MMPPPPLLSESLSAEGLRWTFRAPAADSLFYGGHFPNHPILPGVVALSWMLAAAERFLRRPIPAAELLNVKFQIVVAPGTLLELNITPQPGGRLRAAVVSEAGIHASALIPGQES